MAMDTKDSTYREKLAGVFAPITTPFDYRGNILFDKLAENIEKLNSSRLRGYLVLGTNGEFRSLSQEEQVEVIRQAVKAAAPDKIVMAGVGAESTKMSIDLCHLAAKEGAHFGSLITPFFFAKKMTGPVLARHFLEVAEASPIPLLLYNNPGVTGVTIPAAVINEVSSHPRLVGMKDSSPGNLSLYLQSARGKDFCLLAGSANFFFTGLLMGATGGVISLANAFPEVCVRLYDLGIAPGLTEGRELQLFLLKINQLVSGSFGVAGVKAAMDLAGFYGGPPRAPLASLEEGEKKKLAQDLKAAGLL